MENIDKFKDEENKTYTILGFQSAQKSQSNPDAIEGFLEIVFDRFKESQKLDAEGLRDRISKLKAEVSQENSKKNEVLAAITMNNISKEQREREIEDLKLEKINIRNGDFDSVDTIPFAIGSFITLMLTLYLFVFYSSSGYSAFYGIKPGSLGFMNANVFNDAANKGPGVIALIILFPMIFLGLGFLIHNSLEINKQLDKENKPKRFAIITALLVITFVADAFIGYKISEGIHNNLFNSGGTNKQWVFSMVFSDINFFLVLILGFVVYVIWGFLLNYVLSHPYIKAESEQMKLKIDNINHQISEKGRELADLISRIQSSNNNISIIEDVIQGKENDIIGYQNGVIPINISSLRGSIGEFMGGWQSYTIGNFQNNMAKDLITRAIPKQNDWLNKKIGSLNTEN